jgi:hypothetical protein
MADLTFKVKYKDNEKILPYQGENVWKIKTHVLSSVLHGKDADGKRVAVKESKVQAYINGQPAEDGDIVGVGETLEFAEQPPK